MRMTYNPEDLKCLDGMVAHLLPNGSAFVHTKTGSQIYVPSRLIENDHVLPGDGLRCWCLSNDPDHYHTAEYRAIRTQVTKRLVPLPEPTPAPKPVAPPQAASEAPESAPSTPAKGGVAKTTSAPVPGAFSDLAAKLAEKAEEMEKAEPAVASKTVSEIVKDAFAANDPIFAGTKPKPATTEDVPARRPVAEDGTLHGEKLWSLLDGMFNAARCFSADDLYKHVCVTDPARWREEGLKQRIHNACIGMAEKGMIATAKVYSASTQISATSVFYARNAEMLIMIMKGELK